MANRLRKLPPLMTVGEVVKLYKLTARKHLSQNFLLDMNLNRKLVRAAGKIADGFVIEVGPGPGGITRAILDSDVASLSVVEVDRRFFPGLQQLADCANNRMRIYHGDILRVNLEQMIPVDYSNPWYDRTPNIHIIGNLPFSVSTPLLIRWLEAISNRTEAWKYGRTCLTLTFQKEVADRIVAPILSQHRCRLSVMCQYLCHTDLKFSIPGKAFVPPPKVDVGVVNLIPKKEPLINLPFKLVEKVARHVFHYRQKYIRHGIGTLFPPDKQYLTAEIFNSAGLDPTLRSFMLSIEDIKKVCYAYGSICDREDGIFNYDYRNVQNAKNIRLYSHIEKQTIEDHLLS